jgi:phenylalanyl-tRNA synthetase beta chain
MKVPYTWLQDYVDTDLAPQILANKLTMAGLEVDKVEERWEKIITARIVWKEPVKGSDHLNATRIDTNDGRELSVVCGAPNISVGDIVPLALPGAQFTGPEGETLTIGVTKKRGVVSEGMLCSPRELGLSNDHTGIFLLPPETPIGRPLAEVIIELDIKAHRGDLFSMTGVAREVAAFSGTRMHMPEINVPESGKQKIDALLKLTVEDTDLCPRFTARVIRNVKLGPSPLWMVQRLAAAGMRPISNIVDITNYVMLEIGQPLHAFDYDRVADHHLIVRRARPGERLRTLDDQDRDLTTDMMMVCDPTGPLSVAGVMGGAASEISDSTTNILLEAATWNPGNIRRTSARLGLRSEASSRFEKGPDPELALIGLNRAAQLMAELADGEIVHGYLDNYPEPVAPRVLPFTAHDCTWLLGYDITPSEAAEALAALEFGVELAADGSDHMLVTIPTWRADVVEAADLVEEVGRVLGYDRISGTIPTGELPEGLHDDWFDRQEKVRDILAGAGCHEIVTYPLTSRAAMLNILADQSNVMPLLTGSIDQLSSGTLNEKSKSKGKGKKNDALSVTSSSLPVLPPEKMPAVTLVNPLSTKQESLRLTLLISLLETLADNAHQGAQQIRLFEVGRRYIPVSNDMTQLPAERRSIGVVLAGPVSQTWEEPHQTDFYDLKAVAERLLQSLHVQGARYTPTQHPTFHPGRCAIIELPVSTEPGAPMSPAGIMGEVHPTVLERYDLHQRAYALEIDLERLYAAATERVLYKGVSRYPALTRDLAIIVDTTVAAGDVTEVIRQAGGELVRTVTLFDVYTGESIAADKKSLGYTISYQSDERTLNDADWDAAQTRIVAALSEQFEATLRE